MTSLRIVRRVWSSAVVFTTLVALASCGSRTGLFGPEPDTYGPPLDASPDVDASIDARKDVVSEDVMIPDVIEEPLQCIPGKFTFTLATPQLMFVLDRSGSMDNELTRDVPAPDGVPSRWEALAAALTQTITPFSNQIAMGARFYPMVNPNSFGLQSCFQDPPSSAIAPALGNVGTILSVFQNTTPAGATPTAEALKMAADEVSTSRAVARAMVIATDGAPNCNESLNGSTCTCTSTSTICDPKVCLDDVRTVQAITTIFGTRKIPVYVVGIGVTGPFAGTLNSMAVAGGRPRSGSQKYYAADTPAGLTEAFTVIRDGVAKCSYITPSSPNDPNAIDVEVNGNPFPRDVTHTEGWDWIDQAFGHLQLFGAACSAATPSNVTGTVRCD